MQILATVYGPRCIAAIIDVESRTTRWLPARPEFQDDSIQDGCPMRPFGISWTWENLFVVNNRQLLVFDKQLAFMRIEPPSLQGNVHQLLRYQNRLWAVSPWTNSLIGIDLSSPVNESVEFDLLDPKLRSYKPRYAGLEENLAHFNSILWNDRGLFVAAHNKGRPSFIIEYDPHSMQVRSVTHDAGRMIHGLAEHNGELFWISTGTREIRSSNGRVVPLKRNNFARGFAMTDEVFVVGYSEFRSREQRLTGGSWIQIIDRHQGDVLEEFYLPDTGDLNDLRLLDTHDYAHQIEPFWTAGHDVSQKTVGLAVL